MLFFKKMGKQKNGKHIKRETGRRQIWCRFRPIFGVLFHRRCNKALVMSFEQRKHLLKFRDVKLLSVGGVHTRYWDVAGEQWIYVPGVSDGQCLLLCLGDYCWRYRVCFSWNLCNLCWVCLCISLRSCTRLQSQLGKCILQKPLMKGCQGKFMS